MSCFLSLGLKDWGFESRHAQAQVHLRVCVCLYRVKFGNNMVMGGSPGELNEELMTQEKRKKGWRMNCDVGEATEGLENEL